MKNRMLIIPLAALVASSWQPAGAATNFTYLGGYAELGSMLGVSGLNAGDLDGDGKKEIVVSGTTLEFGGPGIFTVLRADATTTQGYRELAFSSTYDAGLSALTVLDLDADGAAEVIAGLGDGGIQVFKTTALHPAGSTAIADAPVNQFLLADADNDGQADLVVVSTNAVTLLDPITLQSRGSCAYGGSEAAIGDVDGDGQAELVLNTGEELRLSRSGGNLVCNLLWSYPSGDFGIHVGLADIDNDGKLELIAESAWDYLTAWDLDVQSPKWQISGLGDLDAMTLADVNGDGKLDAIIGSGQWGNETAINLIDKSTIWTVSNPDAGTGHVMIANVDADASSELVWTGGWDSTAKDTMYVYALPGLTEKWHTIHVDGAFDAVAVAPSTGGPSVPRVAFSSFRSNSGYDDGIVFQWNAATLQPLTSSAPNTFNDYAWTGIHALAYGDAYNNATQSLVVGTDRLYDGALYLLDATTGNVQEQRFFSGTPMNAVAVADITGDGHNQIVAGDGGAVHVFDGPTGTEQWSSINLSPGFNGIEGLTVADMNNDGYKDIAAVADGHLFLFAGASHIQWESTETTYSAATAFDIDNNGQSKVIAGTTDGLIKVIDGQSHAALASFAIGAGRVSVVRAYRDPAGGRVRVAAVVDGQLRIADLLGGGVIASAPDTVGTTRGLEILDVGVAGTVNAYVGGDSAFRVYRVDTDPIFQNGFE